MINMPKHSGQLYNGMMQDDSRGDGTQDTMTAHGANRVSQNGDTHNLSGDMGGITNQRMSVNTTMLNAFDEQQNMYPPTEQLSPEKLTNHMIGKPVNIMSAYNNVIGSNKGNSRGSVTL